MRNRGSVLLSFEAVGKMLHLRDGLTVINAMVNPGDETVEFFVAGEGLPALQRRETIVRFRLAELSDWELQ